jgi:hypothetical protein
MKHLVLTRFGTPSESVTLHDDRGGRRGPGDVLVRMEAAAVNPSDLLLLRGVYLARPEPPALRSAVKASESSWTPERRPTGACWAAVDPFAPHQPEESSHVTPSGFAVGSR